MLAQPIADAATSLIVVAGANGDLGHRIVRHLRQRGAVVRAVVRPSSNPEAVGALRDLGAEVKAVNFADPAALIQACAGAACVVSALSGLRAVIVDTQTQLLDAAVAASVPRFIPSDFCADYTRLRLGTNRNFDFRRDFREILDRAPIRATSIFNGMFADLLTGAAPVVLFGLHRILYWGNADQPLDFTTIDDTAAYTAAAALDPTTPRELRIAGDVLSPRGLQAAATAATGHPFGLLRPGSVGALNVLSKIVRTLAPGRDEIFPPWQGMQYLRDMLSGQAKLAEPLDNARYPALRWTSVRQLLAAPRE